MMYEFTIVVPIYNEENSIARLGKELNNYLKVALKKTVVLFVNDGSTDNSQALLEQICCNNPLFSFLQFDKNYGLTAAIKAGFDAAETELIGYIDADLQTSPLDFNLLLKYTTEYDLVTGIRIQRRDTFFKKLSSNLANKIRRAFTKDGVEDTGCPLKVIKATYAKKIPLFNGLHRFLPAMVLLQNGKIKQVPVQHSSRIEGKSKFGFWNRSIGPLTDCFAYLWMKHKYLNYKVVKKGN
ncbi:glycosyltransferase family 2 protein [Cellulophaga omnivescoria]|uniref:glycosyltransferase family 2 protein n=1 Tax=Cellulophaga omnivescoria TaxID=1888890 RepID=UPI0009868B29|nr:glycosyltransferase family 2 protein [Cellulophaga omnivescoria]WBU89472.1 glycosyltransferase family 2 protein [Cellulophaga omnivescoria]